jgi:DNA-binding response OmpR family regulator
MKRILVVDDRPAFREPIAARLREAGFETVVAANGVAALCAVQTSPPDLIVLDIALPGMDGISVLRALRNQTGVQRIPVILLTAGADRQNIADAMKLGVRDCLLKSQITLEDLVGRVNRILRTRPSGAGGVCTLAAGSM